MSSMTLAMRFHKSFNGVVSFFKIRVVAIHFVNNKKAAQIEFIPHSATQVQCRPRYLDTISTKKIDHQQHQSETISQINVAGRVYDIYFMIAVLYCIMLV